MRYESPYLAHYGVKGQQWGIRNFQNEDGTLTEAGKVRYHDVMTKPRMPPQVKESRKRIRQQEQEVSEADEANALRKHYGRALLIPPLLIAGAYFIKNPSVRAKTLNTIRSVIGKVGKKDYALNAVSKLGYATNVYSSYGGDGMLGFFNQNTQNNLKRFAPTLYKALKAY